ncbi:MAG: hypothetical protein IPH36_09565 [Saprospiraceae bacterium]|nr:hypothetical protein [Saprospiraceae bacterium]
MCPCGSGKNLNTVTENETFSLLY